VPFGTNNISAEHEVCVESKRRQRYVALVALKGVCFGSPMVMGVYGIVVRVNISSVTGKRCAVMVR
jgi:hypothetical protein|tara:strand:+ start:600 stop:797 length:198 start_codon:yes stop_codon:yes gene_type:complete